jgi:hypothetical protein
MPFQRATYDFTTRLLASRPRAYAWATDYRSNDFRLSGIPAVPKVERLAENLVLLTDTFESDPFDSRPGAKTVKQKLVHLYPDRWAWTSTHIAGPALHSQFLYRLSSRGPAECTLHFTGSQVERVDGTPTRASVAQRSRELKREDSQLWVQLSAALAKDLA